MSTLSEINDCGGRTTFSRTVIRFSQFIKEKRARGATMNLFPMNEKLAAMEDLNGTGKTIDLFPEISGFSVSSPKEVAAPLVTNSFSMSKPSNGAPSSAHMTIFYDGKVIVFDDLSSDKANEVMDLATDLELSIKKRKLENVNSNRSLNFVPSVEKNMISLTVLPNVADMPLARTASLHRFLEKRRQRLVGKTHSRINFRSRSLSKEGTSWLGLSPLPFFQQELEN